MRCSTATTFVIALLAASSATTAPHPKRRSQGVVIPLTRQGSSALLRHYNTANSDIVDAHAAKIARGLNNYEKNTGKIYPSAAERVKLRMRDNSDGLALTKYKNILWHGPVSIGSPPKNFDLQIDTGSADLFVPALGGDAITQQHTVWDPSSSTANDLNLQFEIKFVDGAVISGKQYTDNVTMGGFTADKQTIGAATMYSSNMGKSKFPVDGLLGLAFQSISTFPASPLFETLVSENKVVDPVFSIQLSSSGGELLIGGTNEALYQTNTLTYTDVTQQGYWQIKMDEIKANGKTIAWEDEVVIDTGANYIFGDELRVYMLHDALGGRAIRSGWYSLPCYANPEPTVTLTFGGRPFTIPIETLRLGPVSEGSSYCFSTIIASSVPNPFWTIGAPFLQGVYTVFDYGTSPQHTSRVGFAELVYKSGCEHDQYPSCSIL